MRIGLLGGAFNPPHIGHLVCAQEAHTALALDKVLLMPFGEAPHRELPADPGPATRLRLCRLAVEGDDRLGTCAVEVERDGPSYTVDTLRLLHEREAANELTLILGADQAARLASWRKPDAVLELARVAVATRGGTSRAEVEVECASFASADRIEFFDMPRIDVSSSLVRGRMAQRRPIRYLVPAAVAEAIDREGIYAGVSAR